MPRSDRWRKLWVRLRGGRGRPGAAEIRRTRERMRGDEDQRHGSRRSPAPRGRRKMARRGVLQLLGVGVISAAPLPVLPSLLRSALSGGLVQERGRGGGTEEGPIRQG